MGQASLEMTFALTGLVHTPNMKEPDSGELENVPEKSDAFKPRFFITFGDLGFNPGITRFRYF